MFSVNLPLLITQLVSIIAIGLALYFILRRPLSNLMQSRTKRIEDGLAAADKAQEESRLATERYEQEIVKARHEAREIVEQARQAVERLREQQLVKTQDEAAAVMAKAKAEIERRKATAEAELKARFGELVVAAAEQVVQKTLDKKTHGDLIEKSLQDALKSKPQS